MQHAKLGERDPTKYRDENGNRTIKMGSGGTTIYRGFLISPITHRQPHRIFGHPVSAGYSVSDATGAIMPGATWHLTVFDAMTAIDDYILAETMERGAKGEHPFWALNRFRCNAEERAPELALLLQELVDASEAAGRAPWTNAKRIHEARAKAKTLLDQIDLNCDTRDTLVEGKKRSKMGERTTARFSIPAAKEA